MWVEMELERLGSSGRAGKKQGHIEGHRHLVTQVRHRDLGRR